MRTLVIDSATEACSAAIVEGGELVAGDYRILGRGHAEHLIPMVAALPDKGRASRIAVALGPGSFTGVRVGLAAARALALAWDAQLVGYPTLALIAAMARKRQGCQNLAVAMTGGHGEWFVEGFDANGLSASPLASLKPEMAASSINDDLVAGTQAEALISARGYGTALSLWPDAREFGLLAAHDIVEHPHPLYGRAPDAKLPQGAA